MRNDFIYSVLKSKIRFLGEHIIAGEFDWVNDPAFWDQYGSSKFSVDNDTWKSVNHRNNSVSGIQHSFDKFRKISFNYKVSTEHDYDFLYVIVNGKTVLRESGSRDWTHFEYKFKNVVENCLVKIFYSKDISVSIGSDTAWIKDLKIDTTPKPNPADSGWSLLHQFASKDGKPPYPKIKTIAGKSESINSIDKLDAAGISHYLTTINTNRYHLEEHYMQAYYGSGPKGYIEVPLPDGYNVVMIEYGNWYGWRGAQVQLYIGGKEVQYIGYKHGAATYEGSYKPGDTLKLVEDGIFWIKAIWVKWKNIS